MKTDKIIILFLILSILYLLAQRYKEKQRSPLDKAKELIQNILDDIPKKMQKVIVNSKDSFPDGLIKLASTVADSKPNSIRKEDKMIEAFEDIKDIRYGKIGASNIKDGVTVNKWIKVSSATISGPWDSRGFTLELYTRIRTISSRNAQNDIEEPYVSLTTLNESQPNTRFIKDVRVIRTSGSGITNNVIEVWIQFGQDWADTNYVMYYLYNFKTNDFVATTPQAQTDKLPAGQAWGIGEKIEPQNGKNVIKGTKFKIGDKWTLSGVGDAHGNDDWLRLFGTDEKGYYGGLAAGKLWTPELHLAGVQYGTMNVTGGSIGADSAGHEFRHNNRTQGIGLGYNTIYATGSNPDQDLGLKARGNGKVRVRGDLCINDTCINEGKLKNLSSGDDVVIKGNLIFEHPNGERWVMGLRDPNHLAINKFDRPGFLIREDGNVWTGQNGAGFNVGSDAEWRRWWQHNSQLGRR